MHRRNQGFTLIELMSVVTVVGVLASVSIPAYQSYLARGQVAEAVQLLGGARSALAEHFADTGAWPAAAASIMPVTSGKYTASVELTTGAGTSDAAVTVTATMRDAGVARAAQGKTVELATDDGGLTWSCRKGTIQADMLPASCR